MTLGVEDRFRSQLLDTPISELGYFGAAVGAAIEGLLQPIVLNASTRIGISYTERSLKL